jgi:hypothetical protein
MESKKMNVWQGLKREKGNSYGRSTIVDKMKHEERRKELEIYSKVHKRIQRLEYSYRMSPG